MTIKRIIPFAVAMAFSTTACSKEKAATAEATASPAAEASAPTVQTSACTIVTKEEMTSAVGKTVNATDEVKPSHCIFKTDDALAYADVEIDRENAEAAWQGINAGDSTIGAQQDSLAGIGEKAFFGPRDRLYFRKGNAFVAVEGGFDVDARNRAIRIAKLISSKL